MACTSSFTHLRNGLPRERRHAPPRRSSRAHPTRVFALEYPEALLFDCDGVLVDTEKDGHRVAFNEAFRRKGLDHEWGVELYGELLETGGGKERMTLYFSVRSHSSTLYRRMTIKQGTGYVLQEDQRKAYVEGLHLLKTDIFMEMVETGAMPLRPGVRRLIDEAIRAEVPLGVCSTSNDRAVCQIVDVMLGPEIFEKMRILAGDIVEKKKPAPDIYNLAAERLSVDPKKCVVIEDSAIGLQAAKAAGMKCIVTRSSYTQTEDFSDADAVYDCIGEVGEERFSLKDLCFETSSAT